MDEVLPPMTNTLLWTSVLPTCLWQPRAGREESGAVPAPLTPLFWAEVLLLDCFSVAHGTFRGCFGRMLFNYWEKGLIKSQEYVISPLPAWGKNPLLLTYCCRV